MFTRLLGTALLAMRRIDRLIRRRFTAAGIIVLLGLVLTLGTANPEQTMGLPVFLLLVAMLAQAMVLALGFRARFTITRQQPRVATVGEPFTYRVQLGNPGRQVQRGLDYAEHTDQPVTTPRQAMRQLRDALRRGAPPDQAANVLRPVRIRAHAIPAIPPGGHAEVEVTITAHRRGVLRLLGGVVCRTDPFGLFRACRWITAPATVLVMPRRFPLPLIDLPGRTQYQQGGVAMAAGVGESEEFVALRDYRRGDPLKHVHWRSAARTGRLVVKEYQDEWFVRHALVLDTCCGPEADARFEEAVSLAASFACTIPDQESLLDLLFVGTTAVCVTSGRGVGQAHQLLEVLAAVQPSRDPQIDALEQLVMQHRQSVSGCILVLLAWDPPRRALVRRIRATAVPVLALVIVPRGGSAIDPGAPEDQPDRLVVLESGRIADGLRQLERGR